MTDTPWLDDACSLVDAYRKGTTNPIEQTEACLAAIERSSLNAFSFVDGDRALAAAGAADVAKPFGGVPFGIKELDHVAGWPATHASLAFKGDVSPFTSTMVQRLFDADMVPVGLCTASEFGGINVSKTKLNGTTHNPWEHGRTAGGSSGGSSSAVAGGLVPIATGGDGGGSIRIPAAFNGLLGMKGTVGRIPRGPETQIGNMTVVKGCQARSVRDVARWYDVTAGADMRDPYSLPSHGRWEAELGSFDLAGKRVVVSPDLGSAILRAEVDANVRAAAAGLIVDAGLVQVDVDVAFPNMGYEWMLTGLVSLRADLGDRWPACKDDMTTAMSSGMEIAEEHFSFDIAARSQDRRTEFNEAMSAIFDEVDFIICATNPDVAYPAEVEANTRVGDQKVGLDNNGKLTIPANTVGNPAVSIPVEPAFGLPVGMQIIGRHHEDALLLDLALLMERTLPWAKVAPLAPC